MLARLISPDLSMIEIDTDDPEARRCDLQGQRQAAIKPNFRGRFSI
jgi:hypothetical protein